jgi:UDP-N-acetylmuramyl pentapeptide synthase
MRWESCAAGGATVINDAYNANPLSMRAALDAFRALPVAGRKWLALGAMLELGPTAPDEHVALGAYAASGPWEGLLVMGPLGARIADGAEGAGFAPERVVRGAGHADLAAALRERLRPGDTVLLKGSRAERLEEVLHALEEAARSGGPDARANAFRDPSGARTRACSTTFTC